MHANSHLKSTATQNQSTRTCLQSPLTTKLRSNHGMSKMDIEIEFKSPTPFFRYAKGEGPLKWPDQLNKGYATCLPGTRKLCRFFYIFPNVICPVS